MSTRCGPQERTVQFGMKRRKRCQQWCQVVPKMVPFASHRKRHNLHRIAPELRQRITFSRVNLMDETYPVDTGLDVIFCRNVIIYFDKFTQERLFARFCECLKPGGLIFIGHSETLSGMGLPLRKVATSVYVKH